MSKALLKHNYLVNIKFCLLVGLLVFWSGVILAQNTDDYRTRQSGNWNAITTWERYNGSTWQTLTGTAPLTFPTSADGVITILNTHIVSVSANATLDQTIIDSGGQITINSGRTLTINNGTGTDLTVAGTLLTNSTSSSAGITRNGTIIFNAGGTYIHNMNGETVPTATWDPTSTVRITGTTTSDPSGLNQSFGNFIWNATGLGTNSVNFNPTGIAGNLEINNGTATGQIIQTVTPLSIGGNLIITGGQYVIGSGASRTLNVAGNVSVAGGTLVMSRTNSFTGTLNTSGNMSITGGTLNMSTATSGSGVLNVSSNFTHTAGTITKTGTTGTGNINFNGSGSPQVFTSGGTVSSTINWTVNSGAFLQMAEATTTVTGSGTFTLSSGATLGIRSPLGITTTGATGNIQSTGTRTYTAGSSLVYNGSANQAAGNGLTSTNKANLTIDNPGFSVTIGANTTLTGNLTVVAGSTLDLSTFTLNRSAAGGTLSVEAGSTLRIGGTNTFPSNFATNTLNATSTVEYYGAAQTVGIQTYGNLILSGSGVKSMLNVKTINGDFTMSGTSVSAAANVTGGIVIGGNMLIEAGNSLTLASNSPALTLAGNATVSGTVISPGSAKTIGGDFTINSGGTWNEQASSAYSIAGNITNNGTFTAGSGIYTLSGSGKTTNGTLAIPNLTFTGSYTNTGSVTVSTALSGTGSLTQASNSILNIGGTSGITTLNASTNCANTVNYNGAAQTVKGINYCNLTLSGSGIKTLQTGTTIISGALVTSGSSTVTGVTGLAISGNVEIGTGTTFTSGAFTHTVGGNWIRSGTFTPTTGSTIDFNGANPGSIGASTFNNVIFSGAGIKTVSGILSISGNLTITNNLTAGPFNHTVAGNWTKNGSFTAGAGTISFVGTTAQSIGGSSSTTFNNLTLNGVGLKTLTQPVIASGALALTSGILAIGTNQLNAGTVSGGSVSSYVRTNITGRLVMTVAAGQTKSFPVGNSAYNPVTATNNSGTISEEFKVRVADDPTTNSNDNSRTINRKWFFNKTSPGSLNATIAFTYNNGEGQSNFNATNTPHIGFFSSFWVKSPATLSNGNFTFTGTGSLSSFNSETQFFTLGSGEAFSASQFGVTLSPLNQFLGVNNTIVTVQSQNSLGVPTQVNSATSFDLSAVNTTIAPAVPAGTISAGSFQVQIPNIGFTEQTVFSNALVVATQTSGETLSDGQSLPFSVSASTVYEPTTSGTWSTVTWRKSIDGGLNWTTGSASVIFPLGNAFPSGELIRIPLGITSNADLTISTYSVLVFGTLDVTSSSTLTLNHSPTVDDFNIHVHGVLKNSGGTIINTDTNFPLEIHGGTYEHARNGGEIPVSTFYTLDAQLSTFVATGITSTALTAGLDQSFQNFIWNNPAQSVVQNLSGNLMISDALTLSNGVITTTGSYYAEVGADGTITSTNNSRINGTLRKLISDSASTVFFPIGDASNYTPASLTLSGVTNNGGYLEATTSSGIPPAASGLSQTKYINRNWTITNSGVDFGSASASFSFVTGDRIGTPTDGELETRNLNSSIWSTTSSTTTGNTTTVTGLTLLGEFHFGAPVASALILSDAVNLVAGQRVLYTVSRKDILDLDFTKGDQTVYLYANGTGGTFYAGSSGGSPITSVVIPNGQNSISFYFSSTLAAGYVITVSDSTPTADGATGLADSTDSLTVTGASPYGLSLTGPSTAQAGTPSGNFTLTIIDAFGNPTLATANTNFTLTTSDQVGTAVFSPVSPITIGSSASSTTFTYKNDIVGDGTHTITATRSSGVSLTVTNAALNLTVGSGPASVLLFTTQPSLSTSVGEPFAQQPVVILKDAFGNTVTNAVNNVTLQIDNNVNGASIIGTASLTPTLGIVSFSDISLNRDGIGYTLRAVSPGLTPAISVAFNMTCVAGTWLGLESEEWGDILNWCGPIPTATTDVLIPAGTPFSPVIPITGASVRNITIESGANLSFLDLGTLTVTGNWTNNGVFIAENGTVTFSGTILQTLGGTSTTSFHNLTINNTAGVKAGANIEVNTTLHLAQADPNAQDGLLDMVKNYGDYSNISTPTENLTFTNTQAHDILDSWILEMGSSSITTGSGGVTGKIKRIDFINNQEYSFGSQNLTMTFATNGSGELPDEILVIMTKGLDKGIHANKVNTVARLFQVIRTGGTVPTTFSIKLNYQDTELNGNTENTLVLWDHHIPYVSANTPHEHGKSTQDTDQNWVFLTNHGILYLQTGEEIGGATKYWMLSNTLFDANTWLGSVNTNWDVVANWTSGRIPLPTDNVIINDTIIAPRTPIIPATGASAKSVNILSNAVLDGGSGLLTIYGGLKNNGGIGSWINNGTFIPGTGTVAFNYPRTTFIENATVAGNTEFNNLSILASTFFTPQLNSTLKIKGTLTNLGTIDATSFPNTFEFIGDASQTILEPNGPTSGFYNLALSGTGDKNFPASFDIIGDFVNNTTTGLVNFNEKTITFNGTNTQTISGTRPTSFHKLVLDNSSGILLENDLTITDTLAFFDGLIDTGSSLQIIGEPGSSGVITGAGPNTYIKGTLRRYLPNAGAPLIDFQIGDSLEYTPINLSFDGTTTGSGYLDASTIAIPPAPGDLPTGSGLSTDNYVNRRWILTNSGVTGFTSYEAILNYSSNDLAGSANPSFMDVRQLVGSTWSAPSVGTLTSTSIEALNLTQFGQFAAGESCAEGEWLGLVSTDWNDAANWCGGILPTSSTDVVIKSSTEYQPVIGLTGGGVTRNLTIEGGANLTVTGGYTLVVNGTWTNEGTFNPGTNSTVNFASSTGISIDAGPFNKLVFSGTGSKTLPVTPLVDGSILVQTAVILESSVNLEIQSDQVLTIEPSGSVSTLGLAKFVLEPGAIYSNLSTSNPTLDVRQLLQGAKGWRMVGSPVSTTYSDFTDSLETQGFLGSTNPTLQPNLLWWDETDKGTSLQAWRQPSNISDAIPVGRGHYLYVFNGDSKPSPASGNYSDNLPVTVATLGSEPNLASFDFDFGITFTARDTSLVSQGDSLIEVNIADEGFNLIANPTASILDFYAGSGWNKSNLDSTIYVWDPASSQFLTWNGTTGTLGHGRIAPYQAFWIRSNAPSPLLELSGNGAKNILSTDFYGRKLVEKPFTVNLNLNGEGMNAETFISFGEDGKEGADPKDAYQLESLAEDWLLLYSYGSIRTKSPLVINHLPSLDEQEKVIPLYLAASKKGATFNGSYMMDWTLPENWPSTVSIVLMDHISKKAINMQEQSFYPFTFQAPELPSPEARKIATGIQNPQTVVFQSPYESANQSARIAGTSANPQRPFTIYIGAFPNDEITYLPDFPKLFAPVPNPFRNQATIRFYLPVADKATIQIFDLLGKPVGSFPAKNYEAGIHQLEWIPSAIALPAGMYIIQLATENYRFTQKLIKN